MFELLDTELLPLLLAVEALVRDVLDVPSPGVDVVPVPVRLTMMTVLVVEFAEVLLSVPHANGPPNVMPPSSTHLQRFSDNPNSANAASYPTPSGSANCQLPLPNRDDVTEKLLRRCS